MAAQMLRVQNRRIDTSQGAGKIMFMESFAEPE
jgi:hypothetical protein